MSNADSFASLGADGSPMVGSAGWFQTESPDWRLPSLACRELTCVVSEEQQAAAAKQKH